MRKQGKKSIERKENEDIRSGVILKMQWVKSGALGSQK